MGASTTYCFPPSQQEGHTRTCTPIYQHNTGMADRSIVDDEAGPDPYEVLGLPSPAANTTAPPPTDADIRRAFRRLALVKHPDKARGKSASAAAAEFDALQKAYDALTDAAARAAWDDVLKCVPRGWLPEWDG